MSESKGPHVQEMNPGTYAWCSCGLTHTKPFCDGSHRGTEAKPVVTRIETTKTVAWCTCQETATPPYCDGSHKNR